MNVKFLSSLALAFLLFSCVKKNEEARTACSSDCFILFGRVCIAPGYHPIADATVRAVSLQSGRELGATHSAGDGTYTLHISASDTAGGIEMHARHPDFLTNYYGTDQVLNGFYGPYSGADSFQVYVPLYVPNQLQVRLISAGYGSNSRASMVRRFGIFPGGSQFMTPAYLDVSQSLDSTFMVPTAGGVITTLEFRMANNFFRQDTVTIPRYGTGSITIHL